MDFDIFLVTSKIGSLLIHCYPFDFLFCEFLLWSHTLCHFCIEFSVLLWLLLRGYLYIIGIDFLWYLDIADISRSSYVCNFAVLSFLEQWSWPVVTQLKQAESGLEPRSVSLQSPRSFHRAPTTLCFLQRGQVLCSVKAAFGYLKSQVVVHFQKLHEEDSHWCCRSHAVP